MRPALYLAAFVAVSLAGWALLAALAVGLAYLIGAVIA